MYFNIKAIISLNFYITYILLSASVPELFNRAKKRLRSIICSTESLKILGGGLLSHMKICSIIGDKELNFRVRNGIGCTLFSMATKKFW